MTEFQQYDAALEAGDVRGALKIAYDNQDLFDFAGELPEDFPEWARDEAVTLGLCSA